MKLLELYSDRVFGAIKGLDRVRFRGTMRWLANEPGLWRFLQGAGILLKHFKGWVEGKTHLLRDSCERQAQDLGIERIYLRSGAVDKEAQARRIAQEQGITEGPICLFSVVENCMAPAVEGNRASGKLELRYRVRKCVWIYQYFNDPQLGFGHVRLQSWLPWTAYVCLNGRHWLERQLQQAGVAYLKDGNCFRWIEDLPRAQQLLEAQLRTQWPELLNALVRQTCPAIGQLLQPQVLEHYWSAEETEWAQDLLFHSSAQLDALYPTLLRHAMLVSDSPSILRYFGKINPASPTGKIIGSAPDEILSDYRRRYEGLRVKHWVNHNSLKMYNKCGSVLRLECTINNTRDFKVFRAPNDDPRREPSWQKLRKGTADLHRRCQVSDHATERYGEALSATVVQETLQQVAAEACNPVKKEGQRYRGLNPWNHDDFRLLSFLGQGQLALNGFRNRDLRQWLDPKAADDAPTAQRRLSAKATRLIRLLRAHGLIRKVPRVNRYVLTQKGQKFSTALLGASAVDVKSLIEMAA